MACYFYDYSVGETITKDHVGTVCRDDHAAIRNGWVRLSSLLARHEPLLPRQHFELILRRDDGAHVGRLGMTVVVETQSSVAATALGFGDGQAQRKTG